MDHYEFLALTRHASQEMLKSSRARVESTAWGLVGQPLFYPESRCPFCKTVVRSPYVWIIQEMTDRAIPRLLGAFLPQADGRVTVVQPSHPHDTGGGYLCRGQHDTVWGLLASAPNLNDCPMGQFRVPLWLKRYWNHPNCAEAITYMQAHEVGKTFITEYLS
jgi:hypothetical protein